MVAWLTVDSPAQPRYRLERATTDEPRWMLGALLIVCLVASLPCLTFKYLPMTDLPQHEAIVSIMRHMHDPAYGFERYYDWALDRTLYVFPYFLAVGLSFLLPVRWALHIIVFVATLSYPFGILLTLRALKKPLILTLLALPLLYNRGFFWGFIHFNLGLGMAFIALSELVGPWSRSKGWRVAGLCVLSALTHVYGLVLLLTYVSVWLIVGERRQLLSRVSWIIPAVVGLGCWGLFTAKAPGYGGVQWAPFSYRLKEVGQSILGGYQDQSEDFILVGLGVVTVTLTWRSIPVTWRRWKRLGVHGRTSYVLIVINLAAYFLLPMATPTAKFINFRHAIISAMLLPLTISDYDYLKGRVLARILPSVLAAATLANTWQHLWLFDREAREFDPILAAVPPRPHLLQLPFDTRGAIMRSDVYSHFGAYAQAQHGGVLAISFPMLFWNIPVKGRTNSDMPGFPQNMEWPPAPRSQPHEGTSYDCVIVRQSDGHLQEATTKPGSEIVATVGSWELRCSTR